MERPVGGRQPERLVHVDPAEDRWQLLGRGGWSATNATLTIAAPIDLTPYGSAELSFDWLIESGLDTGEYLALDLFNGTSWQEVAKLSGNVDAENTWHQPGADD